MTHSWNGKKTLYQFCFMKIQISLWSQLICKGKDIWKTVLYFCTLPFYNLSWNFNSFKFLILCEFQKMIWKICMLGMVLLASSVNSAPRYQKMGLPLGIIQVSLSIFTPNLPQLTNHRLWSLNLQAHIPSTHPRMTSTHPRTTALRLLLLLLR